MLIVDSAVIADEHSPTLANQKVINNGKREFLNQ